MPLALGLPAALSPQDLLSLEASDYRHGVGLVSVLSTPRMLEWRYEMSRGTSGRGGVGDWMTDDARPQPAPDLLSLEVCQLPSHRLLDGMFVV